MNRWVRNRWESHWQRIEPSRNVERWRGQVKKSIVSERKGTETTRDGAVLRSVVRDGNGSEQKSSAEKRYVEQGH